MSGVQAMKRIPRIKFPQRHPKPQGFTFQPKTSPSSTNAGKVYRFRSEVPAPPTNTGVGGKASMLPKRTPVSEKEIDAILVRLSSFPKSIKASTSEIWADAFDPNVGGIIMSSSANKENSQVHV